MIRPTQPADAAELLALADETGVFKPLEITALDEVLADYFSHNKGLGHRCLTFVEQDRPRGFAYYAPAAMTDRTWYLYWIAVKRDLQARGIGGLLLREVEDDVRTRHGRLLLVETSSLPHYDLTRKFYLKHDYQQSSVLDDFYAAGDSMVVYSKRFEK